MQNFPDPGGAREPGCAFSLFARPEAFGLDGGGIAGSEGGAEKPFNALGIKVGSMLEAEELKWAATDDESVAVVYLYSYTSSSAVGSACTQTF